MSKFESGDMLTMAGASVYVGGKLIQEGIASHKARARTAMRCDAVTKFRGFVTDSQLEQKLKSEICRASIAADMGNGEELEKIWNRIEDYRANDGMWYKYCDKVYLCRGGENPWNKIKDGRRLNLTYDEKKNPSWWKNRAVVLQCLMQTYGKCAFDTYYDIMQYNHLNTIVKYVAAGEENWMKYELDGTYKRELEEQERKVDREANVGAVILAANFVVAAGAILYAIIALLAGA